MFTGIVTACGRVATVERTDERLRLTVEASFEGLTDGESVAVDGACLTVVGHAAGWFRVEAVVTTLERTAIAEWREGRRVNLERAMVLGDRLGGHLVQGHVDGVGMVRNVRPDADAVLVDIAVPDDVAETTMPQGSITVDGVSLTVNAIPEPGTVQVSLIPYTRDHTTLGALTVGNRVHVEADVIGKYVRQLLRARGTI